MKAYAIIIAITLAFIVLDFLTGIIKGLATRAFSSTKIRTGIFHKSGMLLIIVMGALIDYAQAYMDFGFSVPVCHGLCVVICLMEIASIIENVGEINPDLVPSRILGVFGKDFTKKIKEATGIHIGKAETEEGRSDE